MPRYARASAAGGSPLFGIDWYSSVLSSGAIVKLFQSCHLIEQSNGSVVYKLFRCVFQFLSSVCSIYKMSNPL